MSTTIEKPDTLPPTAPIEEQIRQVKEIAAEAGYELSDTEAMQLLGLTEQELLTKLQQEFGHKKIR